MATSNLAHRCVQLLVPYLERIHQGLIGRNSLTDELSDVRGVALYSHIREQLSTDNHARDALRDLEKEPQNAEHQGALQSALEKHIATDEAFGQALERLIRTKSRRDHIHAPDSRDELLDGSGVGKKPVRGFPGLTVAASSPQTLAGSDFSIFVIVQNPFDVPITIKQVQTHIPIELMDVNRARIRAAEEASTTEDPREDSKRSLVRRSLNTIFKFLTARISMRRRQTGVAIALGTEFSPEELGNVIFSSTYVGRDMYVTGPAFGITLPEDSSPDDLDRIFYRLLDLKKGTIPIVLQPGDSVVKQFVLRTRSWLFFTPLTHTFQIQATYSVDGVDHTGTIPYQVNIRATIGAISLGSVAGATIGALLKGLNDSTPPVQATTLLLQTIAVSIMASLAVVVAFARKTTAQSLVSVEDFWGGFVIGFTVGFFGFDQFFGLFSSASAN